MSVSRFLTISMMAQHSTTTCLYRGYEIPRPIRFCITLGFNAWMTLRMKMLRYHNTIPRLKKRFAAAAFAAAAPSGRLAFFG
mmetsp:Transcript_25897/g.48273  ORF Transcript_25897/g.48273 Transcript_25897/m.48273 type:complete len:82 (+) Transcript_25897:648-893(+)